MAEPLKIELDQLRAVLKRKENDLLELATQREILVAQLQTAGKNPVEIIELLHTHTKEIVELRKTIVELQKEYTILLSRQTGPQPNAGGTGAAGAGTADAAAGTEVTISGVRSETWVSISAAVGIAIVPTSQAPLTATLVHNTEPFAWQPVPDEADSADRQAVMTYLDRILPPPAGQEWYDSAAKRNLLSCKLPWTDIKLKGTSDMALCTSAAVKNDLPETGLRIVVELKKDKARFNSYQLAAVLLAANVWCPHLKPIAVMTDLVDAWRLMWAAEEGVEVYTCSGRAEAIGILRAFLKKECLSPDSARVMHQQDDGGPDGEAEAGGLLKRQRLLQMCAASGARADVADLDDLRDFGGGLGLSDADLHQLRCSTQLMSLLTLAAPALEAAAEDSGNAEAEAEGVVIPTMYS